MGGRIPPRLNNEAQTETTGNSNFQRGSPGYFSSKTSSCLSFDFETTAIRHQSTIGSKQIVIGETVCDLNLGQPDAFFGN